MHYYQFNIADYQSHTRHLTPIEDICYRRMLDWIYLHEKPLPKDPKEIARILILNECLTSVEQVLNEYFTLVEQGYVNVRAMSEIQLFNEKLEKASKAGKASAEARKSKIKQSLKDNQQAFNERSTNVQPNKKQETLNNNHKPLTNNKEQTQKNEFFADIDKQLLEDYLQVRKAKRAPKVSKTVYDAFVRECSLAQISIEDALRICIERNWVGFKADWHKKPVQQNTVNEQRKSTTQLAKEKLFGIKTEKDITYDSI